MVIGVFECAPESPRNPEGFSCPGFSCPDFSGAGFSATGFSGAGSAATRAGASTSTATSSRRAGRIPQHRVHVAQQPNPARRDVDLEPGATHVERLAVDRHRSRRGDAIVLVIVARLV